MPIPASQPAYRLSEDIILAADLGGTNLNFALIDKNLNIIRKSSYKTDECKDVYETTAKFLKDSKATNASIKDACFAVAGVLSKDRSVVEFTNNSWKISSVEIKRRFGFSNVLLINDFEAIGFAIDIMKKDQYTEISDRGRDMDGVIAILGAGTGLGASILYPIKNQGKTYHLPIASEYSMTDIVINPDNDLETDFFKHLKKNKLYLEQESILSGRGIVTIYDFLKTKKIKHNSAIQKEISKSKNKSEPIVFHAMQNKDLLCVKTIELFVRFYLRSAKNLVLTTLCSEMILAGGIARSLVPLFEELMPEEFFNHPRKQSRNILENATFLIITDYNISLLGAANAIKYKELI